jgi:dephospho-CoA kinase
MDELGHQVQEPGAEAYDAIVQEFGAQILNQDLTIDRRALGREVFANPLRLEALNKIVHPAVRTRAQALEREFFSRSPNGIAMTEAAILIETGSFRDFDRLILAVCSPEQQIERAMARDGMSQEEVSNRLARQMPLDEKKKYADYIIDTSGTKENTLAQAKAVYERLKNL